LSSSSPLPRSHPRSRYSRRRGTDDFNDFLLDEPELFAIVRGFLEGAARARSLPLARK
jgi:hypothetical protein